MKKQKNKFIISLLVFIFWLLSYWSYLSFVKTKVDRDSYVVLINWQWTLNWKNLITWNKNKLNWNINKKDEIETNWEESLAIIEWWDWSITRIWWNSKVEVFEHTVSDNLWVIKISFKLLKWKSWSNVISFIWDKSYFHQYFVDKTAAVRWTIFEVNLDNDYLYVYKHEVKVTNSNWKEKIVKERMPFDIKLFSFIQLEKFILKIKDKAWVDLNKKLDFEYFSKLKKELSKNLDKISKKANKDLWDFSDLTIEKKEKLYNDLMQNYQKINFLDSSDKIFYLKNLYRKKLINLSTNSEDKQHLVLNTLFDFNDAVLKNNLASISDNFKILYLNRNILKNLDIDYKKYFTSDALEKISNLWLNLKWNLDDFIYDFDLEFKAKSILNKVENESKKIINNNLR